MIPEKFEGLEDFYRWYTSNLPTLFFAPPKTKCVAYYENLSSLTIFRYGCYQVELVTVAPDTDFPDHIHPLVDSYEVYLTGDLDIRCKGEQVTDYKAHPEPLNPVLQYHPLFGDSLRICPDFWHGGKTGPEGGAFLSIQKWPDGVSPTTVGDSWEGLPLDEGHKAKLSASS